MIIKDSENKVHRYSNKTNWKSKRRNEILRQIFPVAAVAVAAVILVALSFVQKKETGETSAEPVAESEAITTHRMKVPMKFPSAAVWRISIRERRFWKSRPEALTG